MMSFSFLLMMLTLGAGVTEAGKLVYAVIETEADLVCPDEVKHCSSDNTCCQSTSGQWGCCPYAEASTDKPSAIISKYLMDEKIYQFTKHFMSARVHTIVFIFVNSISKTFPQAQDTNLFVARCHHIWQDVAKWRAVSGYLRVGLCVGFIMSAAARRSKRGRRSPQMSHNCSKVLQQRSYKDMDVQRLFFAASWSHISEENYF